ncbi:MAG: transcription antitermination factor NusB [Spirochaetaceae bacterium]|jgi:N utilization substance protein B|nr:transcription antitermination factor NusB [Spirochaetaceae bacterium]
MARRKARILAFQALYCYEAAKPALQDLLAFAWEDEKVAALDEGVLAFARALVAGTIENLPEIDEKIKAHLVSWDITRIKRVDLALLRISVYSLVYQKEIHPSIVIEEAIGISRSYGEDGAFRFINGILDTISKECTRDDAQCGQTHPA